MKSQQYCSVCREWLDMEVVPTGEGDEDDGVIWFRCPQCQGFLPKLSGADLKKDRGKGTRPPGAQEDLPWDSPADMLAAQARAASGGPGAAVPDDSAFPDSGDVGPLETDLLVDEVDLEDVGSGDEKAGETEPAGRPVRPPKEPAEPVHEYAAMLADLDPEQAVPYRPWDSYEVGQCILHLAWEDCGVVVAKERLPGGRQVIKCYFSEVGVVRLIENAPQ